MPRGKNYVNQNKGMVLQGRQKVSEPCKYGAACNRKDCIYSHDASDATPADAPCMAYLAGLCTFSKGCRRRHPPDEECERLLAKYNNLPCRYGPDCHTEGCLYNHDRGVPIKPTPPVCKTAPLAAWMPSGGSSIPPAPAVPPMQQHARAPVFHPQQQPYPPYSYQGGPPPPQQHYPGAGYPGHVPPMMPGYNPYSPQQQQQQQQQWYPQPPQPGPSSMIGSWKPAPVASSYQPQQQHYSAPPPQPPQGSWESQFPELPSNPKNNDSSIALEKSR